MDDTTQPLPITDADDELALLADTITEVETLLHSLETAAKDIGLFVNARKTELLCSLKEESIKPLVSRHFKLVDTFNYLWKNI